jgi:hypothetical protein
MLDLYAKYGNADHIAQSINFKYQLSQTPFLVLSKIEGFMHLGLKNLLSNYRQLVSFDPQLPELLLSEKIIVFIVRDRGNLKFRMLLIRMMIEMKFSDRDKLLSLVTFVNQYVQRQGLVNEYFQ